MGRLIRWGGKRGGSERERKEVERCWGEVSDTCIGQVIKGKQGCTGGETGEGECWEGAGGKGKERGTGVLEAGSRQVAGVRGKQRERGVSEGVEGWW